MSDSSAEGRRRSAPALTRHVAKRTRRRRFLLLRLLTLASHASCPEAWSLEKAVVDWVKSSKLLADLHREHVSSDQVRHMMKSTPLVDAPDASKMDFANGPFGRLVADAMKSEQALLGDWKLGKIVEAAGDDFDEDEGHKVLLGVLERAPVTVFSFVDCPWCLLEKQLLGDAYRMSDGDGTLRVVELEDMGRDGKKLRASIALATGRTSMPACFIGGKSVGGYTDGCADANGSGFTYVPAPEKDLRCMGSPGLAELHQRGQLASLLLVARQTTETMT